MNESQPNTHQPPTKKKLPIQQSNYKIGRQIGSGTFGKVYQAIDLSTNTKVAIKQAFQDKKYKNRELDVILGLKNSNVVGMIDYYFVEKKEGKYLYIVMELYETNLQNLFKAYRKEKKKFQRLEIKIMAFQMFKALYYLSKVKVCHRDLKPPNILLNPQTLELRICDFGSAKIFNIVQKNVTYICSRYYRAPQLIFQYCMYGTEVDTWSAGCILIEFFTLQPIFPGDSTLQQLIQIIKVLGVPDQQYIKKYTTYYHEPVNFPNIPQTKWQKILKKYNPQKQFIHLISNILTYHIQKRLKPFEILIHPYFHELSLSTGENLKDYKKMVQKLPNLFNFDQLRGFDNDKEVQQLKRLYVCNNGNVSTYKKGLFGKSLDQSSKLQTGDSTPCVGIDLGRNQLETLDRVHKQEDQLPQNLDKQPKMVHYPSQRTINSKKTSLVQVQ